MIKKSDLYASLWSSCDELRGGMDASQYKDYVLTLLFMKYVSDKYAGQKDAVIEIPSGGSFTDMVDVKGDKEIGDKINKIIGRLAEANDLRGVIDVADFNDEDKLGRGKEMQDRLSRLVAIFEALDFRLNRAEGDDLLGDAYEYLMRHFATESGKSKGQFYTPAEVSRVMAKVVGVSGATRRDQTIYDPTCGSGSLLLKAADEAPRGITIYGQENDNATWALARMNMILHGHPEADLWRGNTLASPRFKNEKAGLKTFDFAVANPPFSAKAWATGFDPDHDEFHRFEVGVPPAKNGDYAFLLHVVASLKSGGKAAVILPHGVLFRGNKEAEIRRNLLMRGLIKGVIGLPPNLFYGTGIPACIVVIDKAGAEKREGVFLIDASRGFTKDGAKNRLRSQDIHKIVDVFNNQRELERYSRFVALSEIADPTNDYNLNIPRYIDSSDPEDLQDLHAHLHGGIRDRDIDALNAYWDAFPALRSRLFTPNRPGYSDLAVDASEVQQLVLDSDDYQGFVADVTKILDGWYEAHQDKLESIDRNTVPNDLVARLGENLLARFKSVPLIDEYDVYEQLMSYWHDTMHDDVFLIMTDDWAKAALPREARILAYDKNGRPKYENADIQLGHGKGARRYVMDLLPPSIVGAAFFAEQLAEIEQRTLELDEVGTQLAEQLDEQALEGGLLWDAVGDDGKVTTTTLRVAISEAREASEQEVINALTAVLELMRREAALKGTIQTAEMELNSAVLRRYSGLSECEVRQMVLIDKWGNAISKRLQQCLSTSMLMLTERVRQLGERYGETLAGLTNAALASDSRVAKHLVDMGVR